MRRVDRDLHDHACPYDLMRIVEQIEGVFRIVIEDQTAGFDPVRFEHARSEEDAFPAVPLRIGGQLALRQFKQCQPLIR